MDQCIHTTLPMMTIRIPLVLMLQVGMVLCCIPPPTTIHHRIGILLHSKRHFLQVFKLDH